MIKMGTIEKGGILFGVGFLLLAMAVGGVEGRNLGIEFAIPEVCLAAALMLAGIRKGNLSREEDDDESMY
uniref:hypothetical protein n=1 Tax=Lachnoclostridium phocaeense TaxID=1871021 RepID=UPI0026DC8442|nr:hypothetical protein [Lachnoclostridium phocaeense]